jgi:hypothetical protein
MRLKAFCIACALALTASAASAVEFQTYHQGERMTFTRGEYRLACTSRDTVIDFVNAVQQNFDYAAANTLLLRPLIDGVNGVDKDFHPALKEALDGDLQQRVKNDCYYSNNEVFLVTEHESVGFGPHKLSVVEVGTTDDLPHNLFVWLFDVNLLPPVRNTEDAARYWRMRGVSAYR